MLLLGFLELHLWASCPKLTRSSKDLRASCNLYVLRSAFRTYVTSASMATGISGTRYGWLHMHNEFTMMSQWSSAAVTNKTVESYFFSRCSRKSHSCLFCKTSWFTSPEHYNTVRVDYIRVWLHPGGEMLKSNRNQNVPNWNQNVPAGSWNGRLQLV